MELPYNLPNNSDLIKPLSGEKEQEIQDWIFRREFYQSEDVNRSSTTVFTVESLRRVIDGVDGSGSEGIGDNVSVCKHLFQIGLELFEVENYEASQRYLEKASVMLRGYNTLAGDKIPQCVLMLYYDTLSYLLEVYIRQEMTHEATETIEELKLHYSSDSVESYMITLSSAKVGLLKGESEAALSDCLIAWNGLKKFGQNWRFFNATKLLVQILTVKKEFELVDAYLKFLPVEYQRNMVNEGKSLGTKVDEGYKFLIGDLTTVLNTQQEGGNSNREKPLEIEVTIKPENTYSRDVVSKGDMPTMAENTEKEVSENVVIDETKVENFENQGQLTPRIRPYGSGFETCALDYTEYTYCDSEISELSSDLIELDIENRGLPINFEPGSLFTQTNQDREYLRKDIAEVYEDINVNILKNIYSLKPHVNSISPLYAERLHKAIQDGNKHYLHHLLTIDFVDPNIACEGSSVTPLERAIERLRLTDDKMKQDSINAIISLVCVGADPNVPISKNSSVLALALQLLAINVKIHDTIQILCEFGADVNALDANNVFRTPLHWAILSISDKNEDYAVKIIRILVAYGAVIDAPDSEGRTPLICALTQRRAKVAETLLDLGARPEIGWTDTGRNTLCEAVTAHDTSIIEKILDAGADVNLSTVPEPSEIVKSYWKGVKRLPELSVAGKLTKIKISPTHECSISDLDATQARLRVKSTSNDTPLSLAIQRGNYEIVKFLLDRGADARALANSSKTVLHTALDLRFKPDVIKLLIDAGCDLDIKDKRGKTPLYYAIYNYSVDIVRYLINAGVDVDLSCTSTKSPLHYTLEETQLKLIKKRVQTNSDLHNETYKKPQDHHQSIQKSLIEISKCLIDAGADINHCCQCNATPLHTAVRCSQLDIVQYLLDAGADVDIPCENGETALYIAIQKSKRDIAKCLMEAGATVHLPSKEHRRSNSFHVVAEKGLDKIVHWLVRPRRASFGSRRQAG